MVIYRYILVVTAFIILNGAVNAEEVEDEILEKATNYIVAKEWGKAYTQLKNYKGDSSELNLLWGFWYSAEDNPKQNKLAAVKHFEKSASEGDLDAQLVLVGLYLFTKDPVYVNYSRGVDLSKNLLPKYLELIESGEDEEGEISLIVGKFYMFGVGVEKDISKGREYVEKAAKMGNEEALEIIN